MSWSTDVRAAVEPVSGKRLKAVVAVNPPSGSTFGTFSHTNLLSGSYEGPQYQMTS